MPDGQKSRESPRYLNVAPCFLTNIEIRDCLGQHLELSLAVGSRRARNEPRGSQNSVLPLLVGRNRQGVGVRHDNTSSLRNPHRQATT